MLRVILGLIVAVLVVAIAWFLAGLPGTVSAEIGDYSFDAAAPVVALGLLLLFIVLYLLFRLISLLVAAPRRIGRARRERRRQQGDAAVTRTLVALGAGETSGARREAARARRLLGDTPQTLLLTAEAGRLAGQEGEAEAAFRVLAARDDAAFLGVRGLLRQAIAREDWTEAAALARRAEQAHPGAAWLRSERQVLAMRTGAWSEALALADADDPKAALATAAAEAETDPNQALSFAKRAWEEDPDLVPASLAYARRLQEMGRPDRAVEVLRRTWAHSPHPDLAEQALKRLSDPTDRLREAERLAQENPDHPETHLLLARASLDANLPGEARRHADHALEKGLNQRRVWNLRADIAEAAGDSEEARVEHRDALRRAASADSDPAWRCTACGTQLQRWQAACPSCGTPGQVVWGSATSWNSSSAARLPPARRDVSTI